MLEIFSSKSFGGMNAVLTFAAGKHQKIMFDLALRLILGVIFFFLSTPGGMAHEAVLEEARADVFVAQDFEDDQRQAALSPSEAVLSIGAEIAGETEESVGGSKQVKRNQKRTSPRAGITSNFIIHHSLSLKAKAKGVARRPRTRDAQQERTKTVRFLERASLDC